VTQANTCVPTVAAIERAGATPVLCDVEPAAGTMDPESLRGALGERTRAVVPVHLYGQCSDTEAILELCSERGIEVVEDCAQAAGAELRGRPAGTIGRLGCFSFYPTKNLGALGDGGMVVTDDADVAATVRLLRSHGENEPGHAAVVGANSRLDELQAAVLRVKLEHLDAWNERRRLLASFYARELCDCPVALPATAVDCLHAYHLFVIRTADIRRTRASRRTRSGSP
jgi:dTDP-4-amino-4,6-dideoxygalactose transaminase